ncbi:methyl-accepting chemotaxis protein (plasmid) [Azospirillum sp. B510]|uniref:methyl-accepting chemotaxis protein n=1 Tax=Azospirillum sp. (strain B510) TaxID=137722 RepID=UPI0001C4C87A|nr:methyl-accepting chemotaxis protein [Azospirillum sp. B510]BAI75661.1 methyl-accepting chemotaxis protein [Azospirillum sp. B510]
MIRPLLRRLFVPWNHLPIVVKIMVPLAIMMGVSVATLWYGIAQTAQIKDDYQRVVDLSERGKAAYAASGAARSINGMVREMVAEEDPENLGFLKRDLETLKQSFVANAEVLKLILPQRDQDIDSGIAQFITLMTVVDEARAEVEKGDRAAAANILSSGRLDPSFVISQFEGLSGDVHQAIEAADRSAQARYDETIRVTVTSGAAGAGLTLVLALLLALYSVSRPLGRAVRALTRLADGELGIAIHGVERRDEIGATARAVMVFQRAMNEAERLRAEQDRLQAAAEADKRLTLERLADSLKAEIADVVQSVGTAAAHMRRTADELAAVAGTANRRSTDAAGSAGQAARSVDVVAEVAEQLSASIRDIGERVVASERIAANAVTGARRSEEAMDELLKAAERVGEVVRLIDSIAGRTNLLALNATIEAARAGEAGKGFAVVAQEVKALARQTSDAILGVERHIEDIRAAAAKAAEAIHGVGSVIASMSEISGAISVAVTEQSQATQEIAESASRAASGAGDVRTIIDDVIDGANETGTIADLVLAAANGLVGESTRLGAAVDSFVHKVRSAG